MNLLPSTLSSDPAALAGLLPIAASSSAAGFFTGVAGEGTARPPQTAAPGFADVFAALTAPAADAPSPEPMSGMPIATARVSAPPVAVAPAAPFSLAAPRGAERAALPAVTRNGDGTGNVSSRPAAAPAPAAVTVVVAAANVAADSADPAEGGAVKVTSTGAAEFRSEAPATSATAVHPEAKPASKRAARASKPAVAGEAPVPQTERLPEKTNEMPLPAASDATALLQNIAAPAAPVVLVPVAGPAEHTESEEGDQKSDDEPAMDASVADDSGNPIVAADKKETPSSPATGTHGASEAKPARGEPLGLAAEFRAPRAAELPRTESRRPAFSLPVTNASLPPASEAVEFAGRVDDASGQPTLVNIVGPKSAATPAVTPVERGFVGASAPSSSQSAASSLRASTQFEASVPANVPVTGDAVRAPRTVKESEPFAAPATVALPRAALAAESDVTRGVQVEFRATPTPVRSRPADPVSVPAETSRLPSVPAQSAVSETSAEPSRGISAESVAAVEPALPPSAQVPVRTSQVINGNAVSFESPRAAAGYAGAERANFAVAAQASESAPLARGEGAVKSSVSSDKESVAKRAERLGTGTANSVAAMYSSLAHPANSRADREVAAAVWDASAGAAVAPDSPVLTSETAAIEASQAHRAVEVVLRAVDEVAARERSAVKLEFTIGDTELSVRVELRDDEVRTTFRTESPELRQALAHEWQAANAQGGDRNVRLADPVFADRDARSGFSSAGDQSGRQQERSGARGDEFAGATTDRRSFGNGTAAPADRTTPMSPSLGAAPVGTARRLNHFA